MNEAKKLNWEKIKKAFIFGVVEKEGLIYPSYGYLSEKFHLSKPAIFNRAKKEGWEIRRESQRNKVASTVVQKKINSVQKKINEKSNLSISQADIDQNAEETSETILNFDVRCSDMSLSIIDLVEMNLARIKEKMLSDSKMIVDAKMLNDNAKALETSQAIYKKAIGIGTNNPLEKWLDSIDGYGN